jgi:hypothetical protein
VAISDIKDLEGELEKNLADRKIQEKYFNSPAKRQREALVERLVNDYQVLSEIEGM